MWNFEIKGLDDALEKNVSVYLNAIPDSERRLTFRFQSRVKNEINKALQALGYYDPTITYTVEDKVSVDDATVVLVIAPGAPVHIAKVDVELTGRCQN